VTLARLLRLSDKSRQSPMTSALRGQALSTELPPEPRASGTLVIASLKNDFAWTLSAIVNFEESLITRRSRPLACADGSVQGTSPVARSEELSDLIRFWLQL
jgi:hypothetical protein